MREFVNEIHLAGYTMYRHGDRRRELLVSTSTDRYSVEEAHFRNFGIRTWHHVTVSVQGALKARLEDQKKIGRQREGGERSPAPLPDWYELTHIAYDHAKEVGFDASQAVWQYLPPPHETRLNVAEALHLRQPR